MSPCPAVPVRRSRLAAAVAAVLLAGGGAGCYETPKPACAFACARDGSCPDGYACDPQDQICHLQLPGGGLEACDPPFVDARIVDAPIDATVIDAPIDAGTDAAVDGPVDAAPDA